MTEDTTPTPGAPGAIPTPGTPGTAGAPGLTLGADAETGAKPGQMQRQPREAKPADAHGWWWGTGRRKTAVARVRFRPASDAKAAGVKVQVTAKKFKTIDEYFTEARDRTDAMAPLNLTGTADKLEVFIRAHGGGTMGQAQAVRLGIARALVNYDPSTEDALRDAGFLTRDARKVERKKYGMAGARRRFQFSKR